MANTKIAIDRTLETGSKFMITSDVPIKMLCTIYIHVQHPSQDGIYRNVLESDGIALSVTVYHSDIKFDERHTRQLHNGLWRDVAKERDQAFARCRTTAVCDLP